jgi:hypothetical protein
VKHKGKKEENETISSINVVVPYNTLKVYKSVVKCTSKI